MPRCLLLLIERLNRNLLDADLPDWFCSGPTDATARHAARYEVGKRFRDWNNLCGSALILAMLNPQQYGIAAPSISVAFEKERNWHLVALSLISKAKQKSSVGINNRRTNILEGLLNHFADRPQHSNLHRDLHRAWELMFRATFIVDPDNTLAHDVQVQCALAAEFPIDDDDWWNEEVKTIDCKRKLEAKEATEPGNQEETQTLFELVRPQLHSFADEEQGDAVANLTYVVLRGWLGPGNGYSLKGGATPILKRLKAMCQQELLSIVSEQICEGEDGGDALWCSSCNNREAQYDGLCQPCWGNINPRRTESAIVLPPPPLPPCCSGCGHAGGYASGLCQCWHGRPLGSRDVHVELMSETSLNGFQGTNDRREGSMPSHLPPPPPSRWLNCGRSNGTVGLRDSASREHVPHVVLHQHGATASSSLGSNGQSRSRSRSRTALRIHTLAKVADAYKDGYLTEIEFMEVKRALLRER